MSEKLERNTIITPVLIWVAVILAILFGIYYVYSQDKAKKAETVVRCREVSTQTYQNMSLGNATGASGARLNIPEYEKCLEESGY